MVDENIGKTIGIYEIVGVCDKRDTDGHLLYRVKCIYCSYKGNMRLFDIKRAKTCKHQYNTGAMIDFKLRWKNKKLKNVFESMIDRCYNNNNKSYKWYGGKGIKIFKEWLDNPKSFEEWALNSGYSDNLTIDRINPNEDYSPSNCQWILREENSRKAGRVNWITVGDTTLTGRQWAEKFDIGINLINKYVRIYGINKVKELLAAMVAEHPSTKSRSPRQTWFSVYNINV